MLTPEVYEAIYQCAVSIPGGNLVEIGAAHGAATVALAHGLRQSGLGGKVYCFETGNPMEHAAYARSNKGNLKILAERLRDFQVESLVATVSKHISEAKTEVDEIYEARIGLLMIDADGVLDRDLRLFYNALLPGAMVIIDDYGRKKDPCGKGYNPLGKEYSTYRFVNFFLKKGLLERSKVLGKTFFGQKPFAQLEDVQLDEMELANIRTEIVRERSHLDNAVAKTSRSLLREQLAKEDHEAIPPLPHIPSKISPLTLEYLYRRCRRCHGAGDIVDVGSWLGATTIHMAAGLRDANAKASICCFDRWITEEYEIRLAASAHLDGGANRGNTCLARGQDTSAIFLNNVMPIYPRVKAFRSKIRAISWEGGLVELLHAHGLHTAGNLAHILRTFGPSFVPGLTLLVLSDYSYWKKPECPEEKRQEHRAQASLMESLHGSFTMIFESETTSAASFLYTSPPDFSRL